MSDKESSTRQSILTSISPADFLWRANTTCLTPSVNGEIKSARKIRGRWVANRAALLREMERVIRGGLQKRCGSDPR